MIGQQIVYDSLKKSDIKFQYVEHEAAFDTAGIEKSGVNKLGLIGKNLFLRNKSGNTHFLVTIPLTKRADLKNLEKQLQTTRLSFASEERLDKFLKVKKGSVSPFSILNDESKNVIFVYDKELCGKIVGIHPNDNRATLFVDFNQILQLIIANGNATIAACFQTE